MSRNVPRSGSYAMPLSTAPGVARRRVGDREAGHVEDARDDPRRGVDARDVGRLPDVRPDLAVDALQLVELDHRLAGRGHLDAAGGLERLGVAERERRRAIAHHQAVAIRAEAPSLTGIGDAAQQLERLGIPGQGDAVAPGELEEAVAGHREPLAIDVVGRRDAAQDLAGRSVELAQRGLAHDARGLEQAALLVDEQALVHAAGSCGIDPHGLPVQEHRDARGREDRGARTEGRGGR